MPGHARFPVFPAALPILAGLALALLAAAAAAGQQPQQPQQQRVPASLAQRLAACSACHAGAAGAPPAAGGGARRAYYPRIAGKPAGYLYNQLRNFRDGRRRSPAMDWMVRELSDDYLREIAEHFAALPAPAPAPVRTSPAPATLARGRLLVTRGDAALGVPACTACHGDGLGGALPAIPGLLGLPADYINAQFGAWRNGSRHAQAPDCMAHIAQRLGAADVSAISAWLAGTPPPPAPRPLAAGGLRRPLPLACGSAPVSGP